MEEAIRFPLSRLHLVDVIFLWVLTVIFAPLTILVAIATLSQGESLWLILLFPGLMTLLVNGFRMTGGARFYSYGCSVPLPWFRRVDVAWPRVARITREVRKGKYSYRDYAALYAPGDQHLVSFPIWHYRDRQSVLSFLKRAAPQARWEGFTDDEADSAAT